MLQNVPLAEAYQAWVRKQGAETTFKAPPDLNTWKMRQQQLREKILKAIGPFPEKCQLDPEIIGVTDHGSFRIERLTIQSRQGVRVTANAYVPMVDGRVPAVLSVHGHWPWARVDPTPHSRALGLVKLGFFVLAVDAFGAGERAIRPERGSYHGALDGASAWPSGNSLLGLQVYDNMRAVDYLQSRNEVDGDRLAVTGASGGGNQTMYAAALDERFAAAVPVCSVGTYNAYLRTACCVCEVVPGLMSYATEGDVLGLVAPRPLLVINATRDGIQFSPEQAAISVAEAHQIYSLYDAPDALKHQVFDSGHDYNQPMREAMYGWLDRWLRGGNRDSVAEPELKRESVESLRCYPGDERPEEFQTLPQFTYEQSLKLLRGQLKADHREQWEAEVMMARVRLEREIFGGFPKTKPMQRDVTKEVAEQFEREDFSFFAEPEMPVPVSWLRKRGLVAKAPAVIVLDPKGRAAVLEGEVTKSFLDAGWQVVVPNLRATGETAPARNGVKNAPDHNAVEWSVWLGRPLLGQWCFDVIQLVKQLTSRPEVDPHRISVLGYHSAAFAALCAAGLDETVHSVGCVGLLSSLLSESGFDNVDMVHFVPRILDLGDVSELAAMVTPRRLVLVDPVDASNRPLDQRQLRDRFARTHEIYKMFFAARQFMAAQKLPDPLLPTALGG